MNKPVKVTIENGFQKKEAQCDFYAGFMQTEMESGYACEMLIGGTAGLQGLLSALRMIKKLEEKIYELIPVPKELTEMLLILDDHLHEIKEADAPIPSNAQVTVSPDLAKLLEQAVGKEDFIKELLRRFGPSDDRH